MSENTNFCGICNANEVYFNLETNKVLEFGKILNHHKMKKYLRFCTLVTN